MMTNQTKPIKIIQAGLTELDLVAPLFDLYRVFYKQPSDLEAARKYIKERMENQESVIFLAVEEDNTGEGPKPLGFVQLYPTFSSVSMKRLWILNDLYVVQEARKRGIGRALMEKAREYVFAPDVQGLMLRTAIDNYPAQSLYESLGYERDTQFYRYDLKF